VHNVFHAALLRIHVPNDDRLFLGRLDMQLSIGEDAEGEWAIEKIIAHSGSKEDAVFQVQWQAGDITWLPHHQITHLNALPVYLDLLGVDTISNLPNGQGTLPDDPQIFIGSIELQNVFKTHLEAPSNSSPTHFASPAIPCTSSRHCHQPTRPIAMSDAVNPSPIETDDIIPDAPTTTAPPAMSTVPKGSKDGKYATMRHRCLGRPSLTLIMVSNPILNITTSYHVGQIALYCLTDMRLCKKLPPHYGLLAGYRDFTTNFNIWSDDDQPKIFAGYDENSKEYDLAGEPVNFIDFNISPEIVGWLSHAKDMSAKCKDGPAASPSNGTTLSAKRMKIVDRLLWKVAENAAEEEERAIKLKFRKHKKHTSAPYPPSSNFTPKKRDGDSSSGAAAIAI